MATQLPVSPVDRPASEIDYKALSGLAVAALIYSSVFALVILVVVLSALWTNRAALEIHLPLLLLLSLTGIGLSIAARLNIRRSEGARTGLKLAAASWWLSVLGGVTFGAYLAASTFSLQKQSEKAANEWFEMLKARDFNRAYVYTLPPLRRSADFSIDEASAAVPLSDFRGRDFVRFFQRNGQDIKAEPLAMSNCVQIDKGYRVDLAYSLASPEGVYDLNLAMNGIDGKDFVGRQWQITAQGGLTPKVLTTYGRVVIDLQDEARRFCEIWLKMARAKMTESVLRETIRQDGHPEADEVVKKKLAAQVVLGGLAANAIDTDLWDAAFDDLMNRKGADEFFKLDGAELMTEAKKSQWRDAWKSAVMTTPPPAAPMRPLSPDRIPLISITDKGIFYQLVIDMGPPQTAFKVKLILFCDSPEFLNDVLALKAQGKEHPDAADTSKSEVLSSRPARHWRVLRMETDFAKPDHNRGG